MVIDEPLQHAAYDWMGSIKAYLDNQSPSDDNAEVECIARMFHLINGVLYQQGANEMMIRCISIEEGKPLLEDIHKGVCGSHSSYRSIVGKAFRHGFYWPTVNDDVVKVVKKLVMVPQMLLGPGPTTTMPHEVDPTYCRVLIGYIFVRIVIK
jgi:hypothetical protein